MLSMLAENSTRMCIALRSDGKRATLIYCKYYFHERLQVVILTFLPQFSFMLVVCMVSEYSI